MKLIRAIERKTGKIRWFSSQKEILNDREMMLGRIGKTGVKQQLSNCLSDRTPYCGFNGWMLHWREVDETSIKEIQK